ncbi:MAG: putative lipid II flippase FtsW [Nitrospirae bacterium]|nr:putative lipid II flippase FtsW [Nitrospirota bacterium]
MTSRRAIVDPILPLLTLLLLGIGVAMIYSASAPRALSTYGSTWHFAMRQGVWVGLGMVALLLGARVDYRIWEKLSGPMLVVLGVLLALVLVPGVGVAAGGARRWLGVGGFTLQPSELAKFVCAAYMAAYLAHHGHDFRHGGMGPVVRPILVLGMVLGLIVVEPDLGNAVAICAVAACLMFVAGLGWRYIAPLGALMAGAMALAIWLEPYRIKRVTSYLDPWADPTGSGFQVVQSFLAFGSGGITGLGLGEGRQKLFYLPEAHTDFIFSVIGEELGLVGALCVVLLFALFAWRGLIIAREAADPFGRYLALALTMMVVLQALINMGVTVGVLPNKGLPLPFISYGGSALLVNLFVVGVLLNISRGRRAGRVEP